MASSANACESIATASWRSPPPPGPGFDPDPSADHYRLLRGLAGVHHAHGNRRRRHSGRSRAHPPLRQFETGRRVPVESIDALRAAGRGEHPDRPLRQLDDRPPEVRLPQGPGAALRQDHAVHRRHPLQLLPAGEALAAAAPGRRQRAIGTRLPVRRLHRPDSQFPPLQLAADVPVRRLAGPRRRLPAWPPGASWSASTNTRFTCPTPPACG